jgi:hypothetical protein
MKRKLTAAIYLTCWRSAVNRKLSMTADASPGSEHRGASTSSIIDNLVLTLGVVSIKAMICSLVNSLFTKERSGLRKGTTTEYIIYICDHRTHYYSVQV